MRVAHAETLQEFIIRAGRHAEKHPFCAAMLSLWDSRRSRILSTTSLSQSGRPFALRDMLISSYIWYIRFANKLSTNKFSTFINFRVIFSLPLQYQQRKNWKKKTRNFDFVTRILVEFIDWAASRRPTFPDLLSGMLEALPDARCTLLDRNWAQSTTCSCQQSSETEEANIS